MDQKWPVHHDVNDGSYTTNGVNWASFNDVIDIDEKAKWIVEEDFAGASVFLLHHDDFNRTCGCEAFPLLKTLNRRFGRNNAVNRTKCYLSLSDKAD